MQIDISLDTGPKTLLDVLNLQVASIVFDMLQVTDITGKFCILNKQFYNLFQKLKKMPKIWQIKFVQEFQSNKDREEKKHVSPRDVEKYFNQFPDLQLGENESTFDFFKRAVEY